MHRYIAVLLGTVFLLLLHAQAYAFAPGEQELADKYRRSYGGLRSWTAEIRFADEPGTLLRIEWASGKWRQTWTDVSGIGCEAVGIGCRILASCPEQDFPLPVLLPWSPLRPLEMWRGMGLDLNKAEFRFSGDSPSILFSSNATSALMSFNNESLAPLEARYPVADGDLVFTYGDYQTVKGFALPQSGRVDAPDGVSMKYSVNWTAINASVVPSLFDRDDFVAAHAGKSCVFSSAVFGSLGAIFHSLPVAH